MSGLGSAAAHFDPQRLKLARQLQGITRTEVARRADLTPASVSQFESGTHTPRPATLARLALALSVPAGFLAGSGQPTLLPDVQDSFFRSLRRTTKRDREQATALAGLAAELVRSVEQRVTLPPFDDLGLHLDPDNPPEAAEAAASVVRERWGIPADRPVENVVRVLERHGIVVFRTALIDNDQTSDTVDAFSWTSGPRPLVMLGTAKNVYERSRLDAAHELGHILLHAADPEPANKQLEQQAQRFGSAFIAPAELITDGWPTGRLDWRQLQRLRTEVGLSLAALLYRGRDLGLLDAAGYTSAMKYLSARGWRRQSPDPGPPPNGPCSSPRPSDCWLSTTSPSKTSPARRS
ncbi:ImmA/IrrE family metallo-endopeptidase [Conexibacter sp. W3-3-2]|uniref:XRE family transcriptional regulator n=1 Tax=Conexibacter sp. W3-3-2 TaxID=2675227 RepID=UPI0012B6D8E1|nr:XRE family transcriptional regulator [Conexibacter sp. W3-3-2]MTD47722.1 ImmA/IrrE family metallo-endopeptidase [Conexibacter sp. W3-3-2]